MNDPTLLVLLTAAVSIGFYHTLIGVDHSLPFIVLGRSRGWSLRKVLLITGVCGLGHVLSSVVLGVFGIGIGVALTKLEWLEASRGTLAAWLLIGFGLLYTAWSLARLRREHRHAHAHGDGTVHTHRHDRKHLYEQRAHDGRSITFWSLFVIFVLGPCEPLIPLLMAPAATLGASAVLLVALTFGLVTIGTMLVVVTLGHYALRITVIRPLERYANILAGLAIMVSGLAIQLLGI